MCYHKQVQTEERDHTIEVGSARASERMATSADSGVEDEDEEPIIVDATNPSLEVEVFNFYLDILLFWL